MTDPMEEPFIVCIKIQYKIGLYFKYTLHIARQQWEFIKMFNKININVLFLYIQIFAPNDKVFFLWLSHM